MPMQDPDLEMLYEAHGRALFGFLMSLTRQEADTRDVLQEIFVKLARQPGTWREVRDERAFLFRMARHAALDLHRRRQARETRESTAASETGLFAPTPDPDETAFRTALDGALAALPEEQRSVLFLKLWEGLTFEAIAEILEISPNTAASRYRYGLDKMRDRLRPLYDEINKA